MPTLMRSRLRAHTGPDTGGGRCQERGGQHGAGDAALRPSLCGPGDPDVLSLRAAGRGVSLCQVHVGPALLSPVLSGVLPLLPAHWQPCTLCLSWGRVHQMRGADAQFQLVSASLGPSYEREGQRGVADGAAWPRQESGSGLPLEFIFMKGFLHFLFTFFFF